MSIPYDYFGKIIQVGDVIAFLEQKNFSSCCSKGMVGRAVVKKISDTQLYIESMPPEVIRDELQHCHKPDMVVNNDMIDPSSTTRKQINIDNTTMFIIGKMQGYKFIKGQ